MNLTESQIYRYSRQVILPEVGGKGQRRLLEGGAFVAGLGAVGSAAALYLVAAGVGRVGIADGAGVSLPDLQSAILHSTENLGQARTESGRDKLAKLNPDVEVQVFAGSLAGERAKEALRQYEVLLDATEDVAAHYALNEIGVAISVPTVIADVDGARGRIQTVIPGHGPCYRCLNPEPPRASGQALLGAAGGAVGSLLATEAIKLLLGKGRSLSDRVLELDLLKMKFRLLPTCRDAACPVCGGARGG